MKTLNKALLLSVAVFTVACNNEKNKDMKEDSNTEKYTINSAWMDTTVSPATDFYQYANGIWLAENPVPASDANWGSFNILDKENKKKLTSILDESIASENEKGSSRQYIGDYYKAMKDMETRNQESEAHIQAIKEEIASIDNKDKIADAIRKMNTKGIKAFYNIYVEQDMKDVQKYVLYLSQGGLGLPNRDYYFDAEKEDIRKAYKAYMEKVFKMFGYSNANQMVESAYTIEETMAKTMMKPAELRQPENTYHPTPVAEVSNLKNFVNIQGYIADFGDATTQIVVVEQPEHLATVSKMIETTDFQTLQNYIAWKYLNKYSTALSEDLLQASFDFYGKTLSGKTEMKPINERAIDEMTGNPVNVALGQEFVAHYFPIEAKEKINQLVDNLFIVYKERIGKLTWMSEDTKKMALTKLSAITRKLAYPDKWKDISSLTIVPNDYMANIDACNTFDYNENMSRLTKPLDRDNWEMPAHLVNAYYHPLLNEIVFPAGIMQAPFFDIHAEDALNYAGIGMVIGHELTHGFDDEGSKFAADGTFQNWWSEDDRANFELRTKKLGATFASFCPFDGLCVNPDLTMGENIADLGGIRMAYYAYTLTDEFKKGEVRNGFTPAQRFFIAYAQLWKINYKEAELKKRLATDPHSPGKYRVNGPLMNTPEFIQAFGLKEGDYMRKSEKEIAEIW
ncbi:MAG: M13 family metallopeptidase [Brumimicrobium sp.]|nr:M13 family metallopeptidase [Brumimicrobium sp.]